VLLGARVLDFHLHGGIVRQAAFGLQAGDGRVQQACNVRFQTGSLWVGGNGLRAILPARRKGEKRRAKTKGRGIASPITGYGPRLFGVAEAATHRGRT